MDLKLVWLPLFLNFCALCQAPPAPQRIGPLTLSGSLRTRLEAWDWFEGRANNTYAFSGSLLRVSLGQQTRPLDWQVEVALPVLLGLPDDAVAPGDQGQLGLGATYYVANSRSRNAALPFLKQGFLRFKNLGGGAAHSLRLGRLEFIEGAEAAPSNPTLAAVKRDRIAHRLLGNFAWSHVGRSFDGAHYAYNTARNNLTVMAARPTRGVFQVDGWGELDIAVVYGAFTRQLGTGRSAGELRLFGIWYDDYRDVLKTDNRPLALRRADLAQSVRLGTGGGNYLHAFETGAGTVDLMFWGALQAGSWGTLDHGAGALAAEAGYQPPGLPRLRPWLRGGYFYGSGDGDPLDSSHDTFFQLLPTPRWLARFPFYNLMNNRDAFGQAILRPHARLTLRAEVHSLSLASRSDLWYQGGGAFQPWTFGYTGRSGGGRRGLATLFDLSADYQVNPHLSVTGYYANAQGGDVMKFVYPSGHDAQLAYAELTYRF